MDFSRGSEWRQWDLHVHTASSYDADYKGSDSDELLCQSIIENNIAAIAITDHFVIDAQRIQHLKEITKDVTFFPGVELRTDKGATNIHIILIFSENSDLKALSEDMNTFRRKARYSTDDSRVIWSYEEIVDFANEHNAIISIHAGSKTSGIDREIKVTDKIADAIKDIYASSVHIFEVGNVKDIETFTKRVFPSINCIKPLVLCSDSHDPRKITRKENLWIKADLTFEGLQQVVLQPEDRVYIGAIPPSLDRVNKNKQNYIASVTVNRIDNPKNKAETWFSFNLPLSNGLVSIIGNKGSGKSALSDIIGNFAHCKTMGSASFLNSDRFRKINKNYAKDYEGSLAWYDEHIDEKVNLNDSQSIATENAQYLPQRYIEEVCNDLGNGFRDEINRVIFSYIDITERGNASNLEQLIQQKSIAIEEAVNNKLIDLAEINDNIIDLEDKLASSYIQAQKEGQRKCEEKLERHIKSKPNEVKKDTKDTDPEYLHKLDEINQRINSIDKQISEKNLRLTKINIAIDSLKATQTRVTNCKIEIEKINRDLSETSKEYEIIDLLIKADFDAPLEKIIKRIDEFGDEKKEILRLLDSSENADLTLSLYSRLIATKSEKDALVSASNKKEKAYQKYIDDMNLWEDQRAKLIGSKLEPDTLEYYKNEVDYIENHLSVEYEAQCTGRLETIKNIFNLKSEIADIYSSIYSPVEAELDFLTGDMDDKINFASELSLENTNIGEELLVYINKTYSGIFNGKTASSAMNALIQETDFDNWESTKTFVSNVLQVISDDIDSASKKIKDREGFYRRLCELKYINPRYNLKVGGRSLDELSPGEKGIVLLIFYLALSKDERPLIIDQPEDNLDNQSVYCKLVKCITEAKKKRQVIIVTHNPNIAVACDSEQLVYCSIDKANNNISYTSGSIEDPDMRKHVIDVLEGTMPAFDLRRRKYQVNH